jgi:hypothetical protein
VWRQHEHACRFRLEDFRGLFPSIEAFEETEQPFVPRTESSQGC